MYKIILLIMTGFMFFNTKAQDKAVLTIEEMKAKAASDSNFVILDVRTPEELSGPLGKINGVINIPVQQLEQRLNELKPYKDKEIGVICRTGHRSGIATEILRKNGYNAKNILGGMTEYQQKR